MNFLINPDITKTLSYTALFYILNSDAKNIIFSKIPQLEQLITANCELSKILSLTLMFLGICIFYNKFIHQSTPETELDDIMRNALLSSIIFFIISNTSTYSVTNMLFNGMLSDSGCPSKEGIILHTIVFAILLYLFNYLDNLDEACDFDKYINNNCNVDNLKEVEQYQPNEEYNNVDASIEQVVEQEDEVDQEQKELDQLATEQALSNHNKNDEIEYFNQDINEEDNLNNNNDALQNVIIKDDESGFNAWNTDSIEFSNINDNVPLWK